MIIITNNDNNYNKNNKSILSECVPPPWAKLLKTLLIYCATYCFHVLAYAEAA